MGGTGPLPVALAVDDWVPVAQRVARRLGLSCPEREAPPGQPWRADAVAPVASVCLRLTPIVRRLAVRAVHEHARRPKPGPLDMAKTAWAWATGGEPSLTAGEQALQRVSEGDPPPPKVDIEHTKEEEQAVGTSGGGER